MAVVVRLCVIGGRTGVALRIEPAASSMLQNEVLQNDDLLGRVLHQVGAMALPAAAAVSTLWAAEARGLVCEWARYLCEDVAVTNHCRTGCATRSLKIEHSRSGSLIRLEDDETDHFDGEVQVDGGCLYVRWHSQSRLASPVTSWMEAVLVGGIDDLEDGGDDTPEIPAQPTRRWRRALTITSAGLAWHGTSLSAD